MRCQLSPLQPRYNRRTITSSTPWLVSAALAGSSPALRRAGAGVVQPAGLGLPWLPVVKFRTRDMRAGSVNNHDGARCGARHGAAWRSVAWRGVVFHGVIWRGVGRGGVARRCRRDSDALMPHSRRAAATPRRRGGTCQMVGDAACGCIGVLVC